MESQLADEDEGSRKHALTKIPSSEPGNASERWLLSRFSSGIYFIPHSSLRTILLLPRADRSRVSPSHPCHARSQRSLAEGVLRPLRCAGLCNSSFHQTCLFTITCRRHHGRRRGRCRDQDGLQRGRGKWLAPGAACWIATSAGHGRVFSATVEILATGSSCHRRRGSHSGPCQDPMRHFADPHPSDPSSVCLLSLHPTGAQARADPRVGGPRVGEPAERGRGPQDRSCGCSAEGEWRLSLLPFPFVISLYPYSTCLSPLSVVSISLACRVRRRPQRRPPLMR